MKKYFGLLFFCITSCNGFRKFGAKNSYTNHVKEEVDSSKATSSHNNLMSRLSNRFFSPFVNAKKRQKKNCDPLSALDSFIDIFFQSQIILKKDHAKYSDELFFLKAWFQSNITSPRCQEYLDRMKEINGASFDYNIDTPFALVIYLGDPHMINDLLNYLKFRKIKVEMCDKQIEEYNPLSQLIFDLETNKRWPYQYLSPLEYLVQHNNQQAIETLINNYKNVDKYRRLNLDEGLHVASFYGNWTIMNTLIEAGASLTPSILAQCIQAGYVSLVLKLIDERTVKEKELITPILNSSANVFTYTVRRYIDIISDIFISQDQKKELNDLSALLQTAIDVLNTKECDHYMNKDLISKILNTSNGKKAQPQDRQELHRLIEILYRYRYLGEVLYTTNSFLSSKNMICRILKAMTLYRSENIISFVEHYGLENKKTVDLLLSKIQPKNGECAICLEIGTLYPTKCEHYFHPECIQKWIDIKRQNGETKGCPCCRQLL